jgi:RHS repeat-associated protein
MYDGPMWAIGYTFVPNGTGVVYGQLQSENYCNPANNIVGAPVSTLTVTGTTTRKETRGDNPTGSGNPVRTFTYIGYLLRSTSDFKGINVTQGRDPNSYVNAVSDRNANITSYQANSLNGITTQIGYPGTSDTVSGTSQTIMNYVYGSSSCSDPNNRDGNNPYYLFSSAERNGIINTYFRDSNKRITKITYPDPNIEQFTYNSFGQVLTHQLRNGFTESYTYDGAGQVLTYRDAAHATGNPTAWYQYDSFGRVWKTTDARGSAMGDPNYTTTFAYNTRGQLTQLTHPDGSYLQYSYNGNGTLAWTADERHPAAVTESTQRTSYTYDDYKRLRTITTPVRADGDTTPGTTSYFFDQTRSGEDTTHTSANFTKVLSPGNRSVTASYDENLRPVTMTKVGDVNVSNGTTTYTYDGVGNLLTVKDPNGQTSGAFLRYYYDQQNRVSDIDDPISIDRNSSGHTLSFKYDEGGNKRQEIRADNAITSYEYDLMGNMNKKTDDANYATSYGHDADGNMTLMTDPALQQYHYTYDQLDRKTGATYPIDFSGTSRSESWVYDIGNNLYQYVNQTGQTKTLLYDNRGRLQQTSWSANGQTINITYDGASRATSITSSNGTGIAFGYDEANNKIYEDQSLTGFPTRRVETDPDSDGNRTDLLVSTNGTVNFGNFFDYTSRNELLNIYDISYNPFFKYSYDACGNVTQRLGQRLHDTTVLQYDALNRSTLSSQNGLNGSNFATSHYDYEKLGNLQDTYRDEEGGKGERYTYNAVSEMKTAVYSATQVQTTNPLNPTKNVTYNCGDINRNSMVVIDNILHTTTTTNYTHNNLNQYTNITVGSQSFPVQYDNSFNLSQYNGWAYTYDAENRLSSATGPGHVMQFIYDGVGRCVRTTLDNGASLILTYDQWTPIVEWNESGTLVATNVYGLGMDEILYRWSPTGELFYKLDPMGNVRFLLDQNGNGVEKYTYDAFGAVTITDWSGNVRSNSAYGNRFLFKGNSYIALLGVYDNRNRIYHPGIGRFLQSDPIGFDGDPNNLYRFCGNNPVLDGDPTGLGVFDFFSNIGSFLGNAFSHTDFNFGGDDNSPSGSSDAAISASADWWGDPVTIGYPVGYLSDTSSFRSSVASFGSIFTPIGSRPWQARGQFTITTYPSKYFSGTEFEIVYTCPTCAQNTVYKLVQSIRGLVPVFKNDKYTGSTYSPTFVADLPLLHQVQIDHGVKVRDEAGMWDPHATTTASAFPFRRGFSQFEPFFQEMETAVFAKDNGNDILLGIVRWRADYAPGRTPQYTGTGTSPAVVPGPGSRFHQ